MAGTNELCTTDVILEICKKEHIRTNAEILQDLKDQFCNLNTVNFIDSADITDNGDGTYDIPVTNSASDSIVIDDNLFIYEFDGQDWTLKVSPEIKEVYFIDDNQTLSINHNSGYFVYQSQNDSEITLEPDLPIGYNVKLNNMGSGCLSVDVDNIPNGYINKIKPGGEIELIKIDDTNWLIEGDLMEMPFDNKYNEKVVLTLDQVSTESISWLQVFKSSEWPEFGIASDYFCLWSTDHASLNNGEIRWGSCSSPLLDNFTDGGSIVKGYQAETPWLLRVPSSESGIADEIFLYYHTASQEPGTNPGSQDCRLITTSGGALPHLSTWNDRGMPMGLKQGENTTGYAKVHRRGPNDYVAIHATHGNPDVSFHISYSNNGLVFTRGELVPDLETDDGYIVGGQFTNSINHGNNLGISRFFKNDGTAWFVLVKMDNVYRPARVFEFIANGFEIRDFSVYQENDIIYILFKGGTVQPDVFHDWRCIQIDSDSLPKHSGISFDGVGVAKSGTYSELNISLPIEIHFTPQNTSNFDLIGKKENPSRYWSIRNDGNSFGLYIDSLNIYDYTFSYTLTTGSKYIYKAYRDQQNNELVQEINGEIQSSTQAGPLNLPINYPFIVGSSYEGDVSFIKIGDAEFILDENFGRKSSSSNNIPIFLEEGVNWNDCKTNLGKIDLGKIDPDIVKSAGATMNNDKDVSDANYVLDEDDLSSNSSGKLPTQRSVKKYVDETADGLIRNSFDVFSSTQKISQIVTLTNAEKNNISTPQPGVLYIVPETQSGYIGLGGHYLHFDGSSSVVARNSSEYDITTGNFELEVEFRTTQSSGQNVKMIDKRGLSGASYQVSFNSVNWNNTGVSDGSLFQSASGVSFDVDDNQWHTMLLTWENSTGRLEFFIDGSNVSTNINANLIGESISSSDLFTIGKSAAAGQYYNGDIRYLRFNTDEILFNEGIGSTVTSEEGVVLDISGATWSGGDFIQIW